MDLESTWLRVDGRYRVEVLTMTARSGEREEKFVTDKFMT